MVWFPGISLLYPKGHSWWQLKLGMTIQSKPPPHKQGIQSVSPDVGGYVSLTADHTIGLPGEGS